MTTKRPSIEDLEQQARYENEKNREKALKEKIKDPYYGEITVEESISMGRDALKLAEVLMRLDKHNKAKKEAGI